MPTITATSGLIERVTFFNEETGFAYAVGVNSGGETCGGALHMIDIRDPKSREEEAVAIYYRSLISYVLQNIKSRFESGQNMPSFQQPIDIACAGGTSLVGGFIEIRESLRAIVLIMDARRPLADIDRQMLAWAQSRGRLHTANPGTCQTAGSVHRLAGDGSAERTVQVGICPFGIAFADVPEEEGN